MYNNNKTKEEGASGAILKQTCYISPKLSQYQSVVNCGKLNMYNVILRATSKKITKNIVKIKRRIRIKY